MSRTSFNALQHPGGAVWLHGVASGHDNAGVTSRSLHEYRDDVLALLTPLMPLDVSLADAVGCVLARDAVAPVPVPSVAVAARDGYAVRAQDAQGAKMRSVTLPVTHDVAPGQSPTRLVKGAAARIARGAALPIGADAVVGRSPSDAASVVLDAEAQAGDGVEAAGSYMAAGATVVAAGTKLGPGHVAAMAACGLTSALVTPSPRVMVIAVGSELLSATTAAHPSVTPHDAVPDASGALLAALITGAGGRVVRVAAVPDEAVALRRAVEDAALQADLVLTLGGTSDDWRDVVLPVLSGAYGIERRTVRLSPGDTHALGTVGASHGRPVPLLALPGHPMDVAAAFAAYVRHAVLYLKGVEAKTSTTEAAAAWSSPFGYAQVVPVVRSERDGRAAVEPVGSATGPTLADLARADGLAVVGESVTGVEPRDKVEMVWWQR